MSYFKVKSSKRAKQEMQIKVGEKFLEMIQEKENKFKDNESRLIQWSRDLEQPNQDYQQDQQNNNIDEQRLYDGMIFLRKLNRLCFQFCVIGVLIGFFLWGYFTTVKDYYWNANEVIDNITIYTGNCFLNISDSEDYLKFKAYGKGSLEEQLKASKEFLIKGEIINNGMAYIQFQNPYPDVRSCIVDLMLPRNMNNLHILCSVDSECIIVFAQQELQVQDNFNATCEKSARMQMNIRNIQTNNFTFISDSAGILFVNHILTKEGYISMANGQLVIQSTKSFQLIYTSQSHAVCARGFQLIDQVQENCYVSASQNATIIENICKGQISICEKNSCDIEQKIQVIGNQATIYANILYDIGKPLIVESDKIEIFSTQIFKKQIDFDEDSLIAIQQFMNNSGSADVGVRIDVVGNYLLQHSYTTHWSFFSNPSYANFQPWWLSAFSAGFLNPTFTHLTVSIKPGICPWNPVLTSKEKMQIKSLIKQSFNTTYGEAIYIDVDDSLRTDEKLNENQNYFGLTYLQQKQIGQFENWLILNNVANTIVYEYLKYDQNFIAAITLSLISSLIFAIVSIYFLKEILKVLEVYVLNSCSQYQLYSVTTTGYVPKNTNDIVKDLMEKLQKQPDKRDPPLIMPIFTYIYYQFAQNQLKSSPSIFIPTLFKLSNQNETEQYYANELDEKYLSIDQEEIKERYEQFCYLNKMTIESLSQYENTFYYNYHFEFAEKQNILVLSKIKLNPNAKPYQQLSLEEILNINSLEIFFQTQCLLTGIPADTLNSDVLYQAYLKFCGNYIKVEQFNIEQISNNYNFQITDKKIIQLSKIPFSQEDGNHAFTKSEFNFLAQFVRNERLEQSQFKKPVYILRRQEEQNQEQMFDGNNQESMQFQLNPIKQIERDKLKESYNQSSLFLQSIIYNINYYYPIFNYERSNILVKYFELIYMHGWMVNDVIIVLGNSIIGAITILPLLYFIIIINTSYSSYSIYTPETLLYIEDIYFRPWIIFDYFRHFDSWFYAFFIVLICYTILTALLQILQYCYSTFPFENSYMIEQNLLKKRTFIYLQWYIFLILAFCVFFYFGLIIVWLLLGSIINPNFYLVYSSSALSLVAFITAQINQIKETYEMTCEEINKLIKNIQSQTFSLLIRPIIKELQRLLDTSISIITSKGMKEAKQFANNLGFGDKLEELCNMSNQIAENSEPLDFAQNQLKLQKMKETFIQTSSEIFLEKMIEQFKIPESLAKLLQKSLFTNSDEIVEGLLKEIESKTTIPYPILKWLYSTLTQFYNLIRQIHTQTGKNLLIEFVKQIHQDLIKLFIEIVLSKEKMEQLDKNIMLVFQELLINSSEKNILSQFAKIQEIINQPIDTQFKLEKYTLKFFMKFSNINKKSNELEQIKNDYTFQLFAFSDIDQKFNFLYQFLFNNQQYLIISQEVLNQNKCKSCSQFLCKIFQQLQDRLNPEKTYQISNQKAALYHKFKFIVNYLRNDFDLFIRNPFKEVGLIYISLCTKRWKNEFQINLDGYYLELFYDILYIRSNFLWSSKYFEGNSQIKTYNSIDKREEKLSNRSLIKLISSTLDFSENAVIGLILILKNEISNQSKYLEQIYIEISQKSQQISQSNSKIIEDQVKKIKFVIELLSKTNFEDIFPFLLSNQDIPLSQKLIKEFIDMVIKQGDIDTFQLFNGNFIYTTYQLLNEDSKKTMNSTQREKLIKQKQYFNEEVMKNYKKYSLEFGYSFNQKDIQNINNQQQNENGLQQQENAEKGDLNRYHSSKLTFYNYLLDIKKKNQNNNFIDLLTNEEDLPMFLFEILKKQDCILRQNDLDFEDATSNFDKGFENLSYILYLKDIENIEKMQKAIDFFVIQNQSSEYNIQMKKILSYISKISQIEQTVSSATSLLQQIIPYQSNRLTPLFIDQIFQTTQGLDCCFYKDILRILKFELPEFIINGQITINKRSRFKMNINANAKKMLENFIPFVEPMINLLYSEDKSIRDQAIEESLLNFEPNFSKPTFSKQKQLYKSIIIEIFDKDYNIVFQLPKNYVSNIFKNASKKSVVDVALQLVEGFIQREAIFSKKNLNVSTNIFTIVGDYLKYFLTFDINIFIELVQIHCNKIVRKEKQNQKAILALFSLMSSKYDYEELNSIYYLNKSELKLTNLLVNCMFSRNKSIFLEEIEIQQILKKKFQIEDFQIVIEIAQILDYNSVDPEMLIEKLKLKKVDQQLLKMVFAFKMQIRDGKSWENFQDQYDQLSMQRQNIYKEKQTNIDENTLEVLNYFAHPRPFNFIFLLNNIEILKKYELTSFLVSGILGIAKYDKFDRYKEKSFDFILHRQKQIQELSQKVEQLSEIKEAIEAKELTKKIEQSLFYIAQKCNKDLQEAFLFLELAIGLDQILINAIFQDNLENNPFGDYIQEKFKYGRVYDQFTDLLKVLSQLDCEKMLIIIEFETFKTYFQSFCNEAKMNLVKFLNIKIDDQEKQSFQNDLEFQNEDNNNEIASFDEIWKQLSSIGKSSFSKLFPLSQIIFINVLKQIRQIKQSLLKEKRKDQSNKNNIFEKSNKIKELLSIAIIIYERNLVFNHQKEFLNFNFEDTIKLIYLGIFGSEELKDQNVGHIFDNLVQYPSLGVINKGQKKGNIIFENIDQYFPVYCQFSINFNKTLLQQFWKDLLKKTSYIRCFETCIQNPHEINLIEQDFYKNKSILHTLIANLENFKSNEYAFIIEEDCKKSINLMAQNGTNIELISSLMLYYAVDFTFSNQEKVQSGENSLTFQQLVVKLIKQFLGSVQKPQLSFLINLIYNPKGLDKENIYQIWDEGKNSIFIDIITVQVRLRLEQFRSTAEYNDALQFIPSYYLYLSLGDINLLYQEEEQNNKRLSLALGNLIDNCKDIQDTLKFSLKILFRCFLGDIEAWYTLVNQIIELSKFKSEQLSFIRNVIFDLLAQVKVQRQPNNKITQEKIQSTSFQELLRLNTKCNLFSLIQTSLEDMLSRVEGLKDQSEFDFCKNIFNYYYESIVQQNFDFLLDSSMYQKCFYEMIEKYLSIIIQKNQDELSYILNFLLSSLVKKPKEIEYETKIQVLEEDKNKGAWVFIKGMIFTDFSKNVNVAIDHIYQFFEALQLKEFYHYLPLLTSISLYKHQDKIPESPDIVLYPFIWTQNLIEQKNQNQNQNIEQFKKIQTEILKDYSEFKEISQYFINLIFKEENLQKYLCIEIEGLNNFLFQEKIEISDKKILVRIFQRLISWVKNSNNLKSNDQIGFINEVRGLQKFQKININQLEVIKQQEQPQQDTERTLEEIQYLTQKVIKNRVNTIYGEKDQLQNNKNRLILDELFEFQKSNNIESLKKLLIQIVQKEEHPILQEQHPINKLLDIAQQLKDSVAILQNQIDKFSEEKVFGLIEIIFKKIFEKDTKEKLQLFKACTKTIISIKNKRFSEISNEFYSLFQNDEFNKENITNFMQDFLISIQTPTKFIKEKLDFMSRIDSSSHHKNLGFISKKIEENTDLSFDDLFKILDKQGRRVVKPEDILQFLKRLHMDITDHKLREILVQIKGEALNMETCLIDFYEFKEIMQQLTTQSLLLSLTYLGISKQQLFLGLLIVVIYLGLVLTFILIGVKALAIPGTFAAIVNALLPMIGSLGLNKQATNKQIKAVNLNTIMEIVKKAIKIISEKIII